MKRIHLTERKTLSVIISTLVASLYAGHTFADSIIINTPQTISGDHRGDTYSVIDGSLTLGAGTLLGSDPSSRVVDVLGAAPVIVLSGSVINGSMGFGEGSQLQMGIGASTPVTQTGTDILGQNAVGNFDNVNITADPSAAVAIDLQGNAQATFSSRSLIKGTGDVYKEAISLIDNSQATLNGSTVEGEAAGVGLYYDSTVTAVNASITGSTDGVFVTGGSKLTLSGGSVTSLVGGAHPELNQGQYGAGINIIGSADDSAAGKNTGASTVNISNGAVIAARGSNSVGISSQTYGASTANITVSDSTVSGGKYGILVDNDNDVNAASGNGSPGLSTITLNHTVVSGGSDALHVNAGARANITLNSGTQLQGKNGVLFGGDAGSQTALTIDNAGVSGAMNNQGTTNVILTNNASWTGVATGLTSLSTTSGGNWTVTGDSSVSNLSNGGTVQLSSAARNILTVNGNYTGNGGALLFNSALAGDSSPTDKLVVKGNAAGTTNVSVTNVGGTGAQTLDGIKIIEVDGTSAAGAFKQQGRIVAGAYDYTLNAHGNSWYLDSRVTSPPVPPVPPKPVIHVVRPEAGSYIANQAASSMFLTTLHDRAGENRYMNTLNTDGSVSSLWLRQVGGHNQFHDGSGQLRTTGNTYVAQLGGDLTQWSSNDRDRFHLGVMAGYGNNHNNTHSTVSGHGSKGSVDGYSVGMYGTWYQNDQADTGAWVDGQLMYSWFNNHVNGEGISEESYKSKGLTASVETGYTFALGESGPQANRTAYFIEPQAQVTWMGVKSGDVTEANGTRVSAEGENNVQTRLGGRVFLRGHNQMDSGKDRNFQPFVEVNWLHNTKRNGVVMNGVSLEQAGAVNVGEVKLGVEGQLSRQTALWGNVGQQLGDKGYSNTAAMVGIKYSF
jgi:autotransporter family porin